MAEALSRVVPDSNRGMIYQFAINTVRVYRLLTLSDVAKLLRE